MKMDIIGKVDKDRLNCTGSFTKFLTTFVSLSFLASKYNLEDILDDNAFLDKICQTPKSKDYLALLQKLINNKFSIRDLCTYYSGLPYTFDLAPDELASVEAGKPFKHHHIPDEETFLSRCRTQITPVYTNQCKFHYSEIAIISLAYLIETAFDVKMEQLYDVYLIKPYQLKNSVFSRKRPANVFCEDLSDKYDYPSVAITDHGYFVYSNGFYTTLNDTKRLLEGVIPSEIFRYMTDLNKARAASNRLLNGLTVEIRLKDDDALYGYEGMAFSGCVIWNYSTKHQQGYITYINSEEDAYTVLYDEMFGYHEFDKVPEHTQAIYQHFLKNYSVDYEEKPIPVDYQGQYQRVNINDYTLSILFEVGDHYIVIRNPEMVRYEVVYLHPEYRIKGKDNVHGQRVGFYQAVSGNRYMLFDGNLYKRI